MSNELRPLSVPPDPADDVPWIQVAPDVPDVGTADSKESFLEWCRERHAGLQQLRQRMSAHEDVAVHSLRYPPAIARQCWHLWRALGGGNDLPKCIGIPADEMDAFLDGAAGWPRHRPFTPSAFRYIEDVEDFLSKAMGWCKASQATPADDGRRITTDADTQTVIYDGRNIVIPELLTFKLFAALVNAHNEKRTPITRAKLLANAGRQDRDGRVKGRFDALPSGLAKLIRSESKPGGGYQLRLPPPKK